MNIAQWGSGNFRAGGVAGAALGCLKDPPFECGMRACTHACRGKGMQLRCSVQNHGRCRCRHTPTDGGGYMAAPQPTPPAATPAPSSAPAPVAVGCTVRVRPAWLAGSGVCCRPLRCRLLKPLPPTPRRKSPATRRTCSPKNLVCGFLECSRIASTLVHASGCSCTALSTASAAMRCRHEGQDTGTFARRGLPVGGRRVPRRRLPPRVLRASACPSRAAVRECRAPQPGQRLLALKASAGRGPVCPAGACLTSWLEPAP